MASTPIILKAVVLKGEINAADVIFLPHQCYSSSAYRYKDPADGNGEANEWKEILTMMTRNVLRLLMLSAITLAGVARAGVGAPTAAVQAATGVAGALPSGLPSHVMLGLANGPGGTSWMTGSGAPWDARYQYLSGGVNTGNGWATWNSPAGAFALYYMQDSGSHGYLPVFSYYQLLQSSPASGNSEGDKDYNNLNNPSTMNAYYTDFKLLMDQARAFGKPVIVQVEPDLWGYLEQKAGGCGNASCVPASVASSTTATLRSKYSSELSIDHYLPFEKHIYSAENGKSRGSSNGKCRCSTNEAPPQTDEAWTDGGMRGGGKPLVAGTHGVRYTVSREDRQAVELPRRAGHNQRTP